MPGPKDILVTTTSTFQNLDIQQYLKPISVQIVVAAGFLSDFAASFTDLAGGKSTSYQNRLSALYEEAIAKLKRIAYELGANCIVGLSVDMDEISGKAKEMFMINAMGTAVIATGLTMDRTTISSAEKFENVSLERLSLLKRKRQILADATAGTLSVNDETWDFLIVNQVHEIFEFILAELRKMMGHNDNTDVLYKRTIDFLNGMPEEKKLSLLYDAIIKEDNERLAIKLCDIVANLQLLDFDYIDKILTSESFEKQTRALRVISYNKPYYNRQDVESFRHFITLIQKKFTERGTRSLKKQLLSSKEKEVWTCECSKVNDIGSYCASCEKDIYGFKLNEVTTAQAVARIEERIDLILEFVE